MKKHLPLVASLLLIALFVVTADVGRLPAATINASQNYAPIWNCSGEPYYDARCAGAVGDGATNDAAALLAGWNTAVANGWDFYLPKLTFKVGSGLAFAFSPSVANGVISNGATIDGSANTAGTLLLSCTAGGAGTCNNNYIRGDLTVKSGATGNIGFAVGLSNFSDAFVNLRLDFVKVTNLAGSGVPNGCYFGNLLRAKLRISCESAAGGIALTLQQTRDSVIAGYAKSPTGSVILSAGTNYGNVFDALVMEGGGTCLTIAGAGVSSSNTFLSPVLQDCTPAINAVLGSGNTLHSPIYTSLAGSNMTGITLVNDVVGGVFASVPAATGLPQISVGGTGTALGVSTVTMAPVTAPAAPASGWRGYVDTADGKYKVKKAGGTVRTLAQ